MLFLFLITNSLQNVWYCCRYNLFIIFETKVSKLCGGVKSRLYTLKGRHFPGIEFYGNRKFQRLNEIYYFSCFILRSSTEFSLSVAKRKRLATTAQNSARPRPHKINENSRKSSYELAKESSVYKPARTKEPHKLVKTSVKRAPLSISFNCL